jgi:glycosyltransferase involved in cell wall biosynthesis
MKIVSLPVDDGGCGHYRIRQPFEMINRHSDSRAEVLSQHDDPELSARMMTEADLFVIRPGAEVGFQKLRTIPEFRDKPYVYDIDDNTEIISPYSSHFEEYGTYEYYDKNAKVQLWQDGVNIDVKKNRARLQTHIFGMRNANLITVTTPKLAEYARSYNNNVAILPNLINFERWWKPRFVHSRNLRIGWSGGISHYEDWHTIKDQLNRLMNKHQFTLVIAGNSFDGLIEPHNKHLVEVHDWVPFKGHSYRMMCLNLDIAIIPLADLPFNHYKSPIKFLEFSAMGVASVVADIGPYHNVATADTAALYKNPIEFSNMLETLIQDKKMRDTLSGRAHKMVKMGFDSKKRVNDWLNAYNSVAKGH